MFALIFADVRRAETWQSCHLPLPPHALFQDRLSVKKMCQQLAPPLVRKTLRDSFALVPEHYTLRKKASGAPYLEDSLSSLEPSLKGSLKALVASRPTPSLSLSHSGPYLGIALSDQGPVGLDIEDRTLSRPLKRLAKRFSHTDQAFIHTHGDRAFYQIWTSREALGKCVERGLEGALSLEVRRWPTRLERWESVDVTFKTSSLEPQKARCFSLFSGEKEALFYTVATAHPLPPPILDSDIDTQNSDLPPSD